MSGPPLYFTRSSMQSLSTNPLHVCAERCLNRSLQPASLDDLRHTSCKIVWLARLFGASQTTCKRSFSHFDRDSCATPRLARHVHELRLLPAHFSNLDASLYLAVLVRPRGKCSYLICPQVLRGVTHSCWSECDGMHSPLVPTLCVLLTS